MPNCPFYSLPMSAHPQWQPASSVQGGVGCGCISHPCLTRGIVRSWGCLPRRQAGHITSQLPHSSIRHPQAHSTDKEVGTQKEACLLVTQGSGISNLKLNAHCSLWNLRKDGEHGQSGRKPSTALRSKVRHQENLKMPWDKQGGGDQCSSGREVKLQNTEPSAQVAWSSTAAWLPASFPIFRLFVGLPSSLGSVVPALNPTVSRRES